MEAELMTKKEIAESFSRGNFDITFPYLSEGVTWRIVGDKKLVGKSEVVSNCKISAANLDLSQTIFTTEQLIKDHNKVVIKGSGEFIRHGERVDLIAACDIYEFNDDHQITSISSYCIAEK
ncbi:MAG: hypothetical protein ABJG68_07195 [Crocinitomicaceae bacterium]